MGESGVAADETKRAAGKRKQVGDDTPAAAQLRGDGRDPSGKPAAAPSATEGRARKPRPLRAKSASKANGRDIGSAAGGTAVVEPAVAKPQLKANRARVKSEALAAETDAVVKAVEIVPAANADAQAMEAADQPIVKPKAKARPRAKKAKSAPAAVDAEAGTTAAGKPAKPKRAAPKKPPKPRHIVHNIAEDYVARELPDAAHLPELPVPNLGYCCLNVTLRNQKPQVFCNRDCIQKTFLEKGTDYIGQLALQNCRDLEPILWWNYEHGIRLFRLSSNFFPWGGKYKLEDLPTYEGIKVALARAGQVARATGQRLTAHPSEFVKLAAPRPELVEESLADLELHGSVFDLMGYEPSHWNKINIHVGGAYGDKQAAMERFAESWQRLSPGLKTRLTVENDDRASMFAVSDLLWLHEKIGIPIVFDFHHYQFCPGTMSAVDSLKAAVATWPKGIRPIVHWSESPPEELGKKAHAHSDFVGQFGPMVLHGLERDVDVMIEAKAKELALLQYRDVAVNGPLLAQIGRDGNTYAGRERSGLLEGIEMILSGDARLHSRGHKKLPKKVAEEGAEGETAGKEQAKKPAKPRAPRGKKAKEAATAAAQGLGAAPEVTAAEAEQKPKPQRRGRKTKAMLAAEAAAADDAAQEPAANAAATEQKPKPQRRRKTKAMLAAEAAAAADASAPEPGVNAAVPAVGMPVAAPAPKRQRVRKGKATLAEEAAAEAAAASAPESSSAALAGIVPADQSGATAAQALPTPFAAASTADAAVKAEDTGAERYIPGTPVQRSDSNAVRE